MRKRSWVLAAVSSLLILLGCRLLGLEREEESPPPPPVSQETEPPDWALQRLLDLGCTKEQLARMLQRNKRASEAGVSPAEQAFKEMAEKRRR